MKMVGLRLVGLAVIAMMSINLAMAANYTVGGVNGGWDQSTDLATWAASQTFVQGDSLIFQYTLNHDVTEVSAADFGSCSVSNPVQPPQTGGVTVIPLTSAGSRYFICGTGGHCLGGMKLQIDTIAASAPPPVATPAVPAPPPATPSLPTPPPATTPAVPVPPPAPSARLPPKRAVPTPSPKISPPSKTAASSPTLPPSSAPPPSGSLVPPPAPSSAAKFDVMGSLIACSGFALIMCFNL